jgi:outer membrane protein OmpA-like peptidoglycan-associated protein
MKVNADFLHVKHEKYNFAEVEHKGEQMEKVNLGSKVNSAYEELAPIISADGNTLWFTRDDHPDNIGGSGNDIWYSVFGSDGEWRKAINPMRPLNNGGNNFVVSLSPDNNTMLVANEYLKDGSAGGDGVSETYITEKGWGVPELIKVRNWYNDNEYVSYFLSPNNLTMIASAERMDSEGDCDLYVCFKKSDGTFTAPCHMGEAINTLGNESTPFLAADNRTLYFSSDGLPGYGNNDLFVTKRLDDSWTKWSTPQNLGPLINGPTFDAYYSIPASGEEAYFVSYTNTIGESDIFKMELEEEAKPDPVQLVKGNVRNDKTKESIQAEITVRDLNTNKEVGIAHSNSLTGYYEIVLPKGGNYAFYAKSKGFYAIRQHVDLTGLTEYQERKVELLLAPIEIGENILLNNVFFVQSKAEIQKESHAELNNLVKLLKRNKSLKVLIEGHTHNVGSSYKNQVLSNERARALKSYLVKKGIKESRMEVKGYGETQPIADNNNPVERLKNSRVEFKIIAY